jgi:hypothetical protein
MNFLVVGMMMMAKHDIEKAAKTLRADSGQVTSAIEYAMT